MKNFPKYFRSSFENGFVSSGIGASHKLIQMNTAPLRGESQNPQERALLFLRLPYLS